MKTNKGNIPTELDLNKHEFLAIFLRWHFKKISYTHRVNYTLRKISLYFLFTDFQNLF